MGRGRVLWAAALLVAGLWAPAQAGNTATQTVTFRVDPIDELAVDGDPGLLAVKSAVAGGVPAPAADASTTLSVTTNGRDRKITGTLDANLPPQVTLTVELDGLGAGSVPLSVDGVDLAAGISQRVSASTTIVYTLSAGVGVSPFPSETRVVTYTITDGA